MRGGEGFTCVRVHHPSPIISRCLCLQCVSVCAYANAHACNGLHMFFICFSLLKHTHTVPCVNRSCCCVRHISLNGCVSVCVCVSVYLYVFECQPVSHSVSRRCASWRESIEARLSDTDCLYCSVYYWNTATQLSADLWIGTVCGVCACICVCTQISSCLVPRRKCACVCLCVCVCVCVCLCV